MVYVFFPKFLTLRRSGIFGQNLKCNLAWPRSAHVLKMNACDWSLHENAQRYFENDQPITLGNFRNFRTEILFQIKKTEIYSLCYVKKIFRTFVSHNLCPRRKLWNSLCALSYENQGFVIQLFSLVQNKSISKIYVDFRKIDL